MSLTGLSLVLSLGLISITLPTLGHHPTAGLGNTMVVSVGGPFAISSAPRALVWTLGGLNPFHVLTTTFWLP